MNHHLRHINPVAAAKKVKGNLPVSIKELAVASGVSYDVARKWSRAAGFPWVPGSRRVFPLDFEAWRRQALGLPERAAAPSKPEHPPLPTAGTVCGPSLTRDLPNAWPQKAARLLGQA